MGDVKREKGKKKWEEERSSSDFMDLSLSVDSHLYSRTSTCRKSVAVRVGLEDYERMISHFIR